MERKKKAIIYARCSTEEQHQSGNSIEYQFNQIESHPMVNSCEVIGKFYDVISGTTFDRTELNKVFNLCQQMDSNIDYIFIEKWDRFGRNTEMHFATVRQFQELGVEVNAVYQMIDFSQSMWPNFLGMYATTAHSESLNISQRTKNGIATAQRNGYYTANPPVGYTRIATGDKTRSGNDRKVLVIDPVKGKLVRNVFERFIAGENRGELYHSYSEKLGIKKNVFYRMFTNITYAGYIDCKAHNFLPQEIVKGKHQGIISLDEYNLMQRMIDGSPGPNAGKTWNVKSNEHRDFFLKGIIEANGKKMTASSSRSKNGNYYSYYHTTGKNRKNVSVDFAHKLIEDVISELSYKNQDMADHVIEAANDKRLELQAELAGAKSRLIRIAKRIDNLEKKFLDNEIDSNQYNDLTYKLSKEKIEVQLIHDDLSEDLLFFSDFTPEKFEHLLSIESIYCTSNGLAKKRILNCIFPEGLSIDKNQRKVRTPYINQFFSVSNNKIRNCEIVKLKRGLEFSSSPLKGGRSHQVRTLFTDIRDLLMAV